MTDTKSSVGIRQSCFSLKRRIYEDALKELRLKQEDSRDWQSVDQDKPDTKIPIIDVDGFATYKEGVFETLQAAKDWAYKNVNDYAFYALKVGTQGWLFAADIHH